MDYLLIRPIPKEDKILFMTIEALDTRVSVALDDELIEEKQFDSPPEAVRWAVSRATAQLLEKTKGKPWVLENAVYQDHILRLLDWLRRRHAHFVQHPPEGMRVYSEVFRYRYSRLDSFRQSVRWLEAAPNVPPELTLWCQDLRGLRLQLSSELDDGSMMWSAICEFPGTGDVHQGQPLIWRTSPAPLRGFPKPRFSGATWHPEHGCYALWDEDEMTLRPDLSLPELLAYFRQHWDDILLHTAYAGVR